MSKSSNSYSRRFLWLTVNATLTLLFKVAFLLLAHVRGKEVFYISYIGSIQKNCDSLAPFLTLNYDVDFLTVNNFLLTGKKAMSISTH